MMKKILVVYFSRTGFTNGIAEKLAKTLHADIEAIKIPHNFGNQHGIMAFRTEWENNGYFRSLYEAITHTTPVIETFNTKLDTYDCIVLGTPVWSWNMAGPMRTFITQNDLRKKNIALFCTYGGSGSEKVFHDMELLIGKKSVAQMAIKDYEIITKQVDDKIKQFVTQLEFDGQATLPTPIIL